MGDAVFAPLYQVLKQRGVKFKFFHKVTNLGLDADKKAIATITIARQVNLKSEEYQPLITVKGLPCWPSEPLYDQIEGGESLKSVNLESFYSSHVDVGSETLTYKEDFDRVVLGIPVASFPYICPELLEANQKWRDMVYQIKTVQTQSLQVWLKPDNAGLGWPLWMKQNPIVDTYLEPFDTWVDMSQVLCRECWPTTHDPNQVAYFCSVLPGPDLPPPPTQNHFPTQAMNQAKANALNLLEQNMKDLWPNAYGKEGFNWNLVVDPENRQGKERLNAQYLRVNVDPSERYVLAVAGSSQYRLKTDKSGFSNLYLTGDWIDNGFNSGCVEAAVMSGMQTSRAICGYPQQIVGEDF
ncbi:hypothetical protein [Phormidium sp. CCY1219]|uniref:hypothetical protein n=1 Tax=Phormidium sp. CCY1219 TaxID=2886104 RepID=UPI002D1EF642|nr:hypothetical protein [Phormidium sp. CCY1219]MEB3826804.1 hypothetical protein [Phormidium sp. CCY1219]